jgi:hypothetical protein
MTLFKSLVRRSLESATVYKAVALVLWVVLFGAVSAVWNLVGSPQSFRDFGVLLAMVCVAVVIGGLAWVGRRVGSNEDVDDPAIRRTNKLAVGGLLLGLLLAVGLTVYNVMGSGMEERAADAGRSQREMLGGLERSNGAAALEAMKAKRGARTATE